ncbi:uncharacterized protein TRIADDRAFT_54007 [Trichoplax adhaerens]|uniref:RRM domain-containing protein n=1 Tax=Trichoplax adhaerens TaxID=10228 RepID=B3RQV0_TRIAD|nr:predicted protein [Trichoplax adhaerens]EDV26769.1 predicted protein [Trichoplax adhaerens]|eukprot:XP_002110765.1 predicted protein [Trichoplax adhaerens]
MSTRQAAKGPRKANRKRQRRPLVNVVIEASASESAQVDSTNGNSERGLAEALPNSNDLLSRSDSIEIKETEADLMKDLSDVEYADEDKLLRSSDEEKNEQIQEETAQNITSASIDDLPDDIPEERKHDEEFLDFDSEESDNSERVEKFASERSSTTVVVPRSDQSRHANIKDVSLDEHIKSGSIKMPQNVNVKDNKKKKLNKNWHNTPKQFGHRQQGQKRFPAPFQMPRSNPVNNQRNFDMRPFAPRPLFQPRPQQGQIGNITSNNVIKNTDYLFRVVERFKKDDLNILAIGPPHQPRNIHVNPQFLANRGAIGNGPQNFQPPSRPPNAPNFPPSVHSRLGINNRLGNPQRMNTPVPPQPVPQPPHQMPIAPPVGPPRFQTGVAPPQMPPVTVNTPPVPPTNMPWLNNPQMQFQVNQTPAPTKPQDMSQTQPKILSKQMAENNQLYETMQKQLQRSEERRKQRVLRGNRSPSRSRSRSLSQSLSRSRSRSRSSSSYDRRRSSRKDSSRRRYRPYKSARSISKSPKRDWSSSSRSRSFTGSSTNGSDNYESDISDRSDQSSEENYERSASRENSHSIGGESISLEEESDFSEKSRSPPPPKRPIKDSYPPRRAKRYRMERLDDSKRPSRPNQDRSRPSHHSFSKRERHNRYDKSVKDVSRREERNVHQTVHHGTRQKASKSTRIVTIAREQSRKQKSPPRSSVVLTTNNKVSNEDRRELVIGFLSPNTNYRKLYKILSDIGPVESLQMDSKRQKAYVVFAKSDYAVACRRRLHRYCNIFNAYIC